MKTLSQYTMKALLTSTALATLLRTSAQAQQDIDITLHDNGDNTLEVRVRPPVMLDPLFSSVVFTLKWTTGSGITMNDAVSAADVGIGISPSGGQQQADGFTYQVFSGFGFDLLDDHGQVWNTGSEYAILTIPYTGNGAIELAEDHWTGEHNADYYASVGGEDRTGTIYGTLTSNIAEEPAAPLVSVWPNPTDGICAYSIIRSGEEPVVLELSNASGQVVLTERNTPRSNVVKGELDLTSLSSGTYMLRIVGDPAGARYSIIRR
jgi:hypothetical protein